MARKQTHHLSPRERLVYHVQHLEELAEAKELAAGSLKEGFELAELDGLDPKTLKVVLKLRKMTPAERVQRRALEAIYLSSLGMLDGDALPESARRRLDPDPPPSGNGDTPADEPNPAAPEADTSGAPVPDVRPTSRQEPPQKSLALKEPEEARTEGAAAAAEGKRIYDNPYPAGDPCRAAWDEGWCAQRKSNGLEPPEAYQRRTEKPAPKDAAPSGEAAEGA